MCLRRLLKRKGDERLVMDKEASPTPAPPPEEQRWLSRKLFKRFGRFFDPSRGGLNMPKHQRCPDCSRRSKRKDKTMNGANYWCPGCHQSFFVMRPPIKRHE